MFRHIAIFMVGATAIANLNAGSLGINPGDYLNPNGTVSIGLLPAGDGITNSHFAASTLMNTTNIIDMSGGGSASLPQTSFACTANCQGGQTATTPAPGSATIFQPAGAPEFDLLGDTANTTSIQDWISTSTATAAGTITIPVGIFGVSSVDTMFNTVSGLTSGGTVCTSNNGLNPLTNCSNTASYAYVTLNLLSATNVAATEVFALINGVTQANILDGATTGTSGSTSASYAVLDSVSGTNYNVNTQQVFSSTISGGTQNGDTLILDAQEFPIFSEYSGYELVSVAVTDTGTASTNHEILSALTIAPSVPEPATFLMLFGGLGAIGAARLRRKTSQN
jgi:PEP-CTERM motif